MKICIVGSAGAGKSTASMRLARAFNVTAYAFDEIYWNMRSAQYVKNSEESIASATAEIAAKDRWIVEGAYDKRLAPLLAACTVILKLETPFWLRSARLLKRFASSVTAGKRPRETLWNTLCLEYLSFFIIHIHMT